MPTPLKLLLKIISLTLLLAIIAVVSMIFIVNPNQYKPALKEAVFNITGYDLIIDGDIEFNFRPYIGFSINDVRLLNPGKTQQLASTSAVALKVDFGELLGGKLYIEEFRADDFHLNWYVDANGDSIWEMNPQPGSADTSTNATDPADPAPAIPNQTADPTSDIAVNNSPQHATDSTATISAEFKLINIANASIDYTDVVNNQRYSLTDMNFTSRELNLDNRPFSIETGFNLVDHGTEQTYPLALTSSAAIDLANDNADLRDINLTFTPMRLQGDIQVRDFSGALTLDGSLKSNRFALPDLLASLGLADSPSSAQAGAPAVPAINSDEAQQLSFEFAFSGDLDQFSMPAFSARLGDMQLDANARIQLASALAPLNISYEVRTNALDLTPYLADKGVPTGAPLNAANNTAPAPDSNVASTETQTPAAADQSEPSTSIEIPRELLKSMDVRGTVSIASLTIDQLHFGEIELFTNLEDGLLDIETSSISTLDGNMQGTIHLDSRAAEARLQTRFALKGVDLTELARTVPQLETVAGKLQVDMDFTANGNNVDQLTDSLNGLASFGISENAVDISLIKQIFTSIAALSPQGTSIAQWPDIIHFTTIGGFLKLQDGLGSNQEIHLVMDNFDMAGSGGIDLKSEQFDYEFAFTLLGEPHVQTIPIDETYRDIAWPVHCEAALSDEVSKYCRPDFGEVRKIFSQALGNEVRNRLDEEISDKVPAELQDATRNLLRNLFN